MKQRHPLIGLGLIGAQGWMVFKEATELGFPD